MRNAYELRRSERNPVSRIAARPQIPASRPGRRLLPALDLTRALRLVLALLLYVLRLRLDSQMLSPKRAQQIRSDMLGLIRELTATDRDAPAETLPAAVTTPAMLPPTRVVSQTVPRIHAVPAAVSPPARPAAPKPAPHMRSLAAAPANSFVIEGMSQESLAELSLSELREFARFAARDTKPMFEQALIAAYRKQLIAMFCGPFSVKLETEDYNYPEFRLICRGAQTLVLKRSKAAAGANAEPDAYEMLRECWHAQKRPQHFRVEQQSGEFARELLSCADELKTIRS